MDKDSPYSNLPDHQLTSLSYCAFANLIKADNINFTNKYKLKNTEGTLKQDIGDLKKDEFIVFSACKNVIKIENKNITFKVTFKPLVISNLNLRTKNDPFFLKQHLETIFNITDHLSQNSIVAYPKNKLRDLDPKYKYILMVHDDRIEVYHINTRMRIDVFSATIPEPSIYQI